jgi:hypothetical protein
MILCRSRCDMARVMRPSFDSGTVNVFYTKVSFLLINVENGSASLRA